MKGSKELKSFNNRIFQKLTKQGYRFVGNYGHSAVKICQWTKESLRTGRVCYKEIWYSPVQSHRCMMMTPNLGCNCRCIHCWRLQPSDIFQEYDMFSKVQEIFDDPKLIVEEAINERKKLLSGWKGNEKVDKKKVEESMKPTMMTMSLSGEPTLYPMVSNLVEESQRLGMKTFLVTNGTMPKVLENLDNLPYQLYISLIAPDKKTYNKIVRSFQKDAWERQNETLSLLPSLATRKVLRITMIKGVNMMKHEKYAEFIKIAQPDFVEIKAYEWVGQSQHRLERAAMPFMEELEEFAVILENISGYQIKGKFKPSGAILLV